MAEIGRARCSKHNIRMYVHVFDQSHTADRSQAQGGIGLWLRSDEHGVVRIKRVLAKGPAALSGVIEVGDTLVEVDGRSVEEAPAAVLCALHGDSVSFCNEKFCVCLCVQRSVEEALAAVLCALHGDSVSFCNEKFCVCVCVCAEERRRGSCGGVVCAAWRFGEFL